MRPELRSGGARRPATELSLHADPDERTAVSAARARTRHGPRRAPAQRRRGFGRVLLRASVLLLLWVAIIGGCVIGYFTLTLPDTSQLTTAERRPSVTILAADGATLATFGDLFGLPLTLKEMSPYLPKAVVATEDRRFYSHF